MPLSSWLALRRLQLHLAGPRLADVGAALRNQASLVALTEEVIKTSEIEGEQLKLNMPVADRHSRIEAWMLEQAGIEQPR